MNEHEIHVTNEQLEVFGELLRTELKRIEQLFTVHLDHLERRLERFEQRQPPLDAKGKQLKP